MPFYILLTWYCTKLQLGDLQYPSTMHHMDTCFAYECWSTNPGCVDFSWTVLLPKICAPLPPLLHTTLRQKWGGGICSNIQFILCIYPSPFLTILSMPKVDNHDNCCKKQQLRWMCTADNQRRLCCSKDKRHWSNLHCQWWQGMTLCKLAFSVWATILAVVSEWGYSNFVCACFLVQSTMGS